MRRLVLFSLAIVAVFCWLNRASAASPEAPRMEIRETNFDFKEAFEGDKVSHEFIVKNTGSGVLNIKEVRSG